MKYYISFRCDLISPDQLAHALHLAADRISLKQKIEQKVYKNGGFGAEEIGIFEILENEIESEAKA